MENTERIAALRREILGVLHEAGAPILLGTDSPQIFSVPGFSIHGEAVSYVEAGMTPYEVLESGTRLVAEHVARSGRIVADFGVIAPGNRADLVLLDANPLQNIGATRGIAGVVAGGRYLSAGDIGRRSKPSPPAAPPGNPIRERLRGHRGMRRPGVQGTPAASAWASRPASCVSTRLTSSAFAGANSSRTIST